MKPALPIVCILALLPLAAIAAEGSPQARCEQRTAKQQQAVNKLLARIEKRTQRGVTPAHYVPVDLSMYSTSPGLSFHSGESPGLSPHTFTVSISSLSDYAVLRRELVLIELRRKECARFPDMDQPLAQRTKVSRANVSWKYADARKAIPPASSW